LEIIINTTISQTIGYRISYKWLTYPKQLSAIGCCIKTNWIGFKKLATIANKIGYHIKNSWLPYPK